MRDQLRRFRAESCFARRVAEVFGGVLANVGTAVAAMRTPKEGPHVNSRIT